MDDSWAQEWIEDYATAWREGDADTVGELFTEDAVYTEPPDIQLYVGHDELGPYFAALTPGTSMRFHAIALDAENNKG